MVVGGLLPPYRILFFKHCVLCYSREDMAVLDSGLGFFYPITVCIRAFHMTSIVVSLYFKQENCETLISRYN